MKEKINKKTIDFTDIIKDVFQSGIFLTLNIFLSILYMILASWTSKIYICSIMGLFHVIISVFYWNLYLNLKSLLLVMITELVNINELSESLKDKNSN